MTIEQFNATGWTGKMSATYKTGKSHKIVGVDFDEQLVALAGVIENEPERESWVRCENITINPPNEKS
jgi:hypothetical protein